MYVRLLELAALASCFLLSALNLAALVNCSESILLASSGSLVAVTCVTVRFIFMIAYRPLRLIQQAAFRGRKQLQEAATVGYRWYAHLREIQWLRKHARCFSGALTLFGLDGTSALLLLMLKAGLMTVSLALLGGGNQLIELETSVKVSD